jgi:hypothetical protein
MFDFSKVGTFNHMFLMCDELEHIELDCSSVTTMINAFGNCTNLKTVKLHNTTNNKSLAHTFSGCKNLISVETLDCSSITAYVNPFYNCDSLVTLKFVPETIKASITIPSPVLSDESKDSIINGLAYVTTAQTLTVSKNAGFTAEHKATAQSKGWTVVEQ